MIVDLKTGKREPQTDAKVLDNPQLGAYQLAFESGAIPAAAAHPPGGAKLLVLRPTAARADYATPWQPPFDDERRAGRSSSASAPRSRSCAEPRSPRPTKTTAATSTRTACAASTRSAR